MESNLLRGAQQQIVQPSEGVSSLSVEGLSQRLKDHLSRVGGRDSHTRSVGGPDDLLDPLSFPCCDPQFELIEQTQTHQSNKSEVEKLFPGLVLKIKAPFQPKAITDSSTVRQKHISMEKWHLPSCCHMEPGHQVA